MKHSMKLTTKCSRIVILACFTLAMLIGATNALSAAATPNPWTGGGGDFLWSNSGNWFEVQQVTDSAQFLTEVSATAPGVVNNIVDTDFTVQQLWYSPTNVYHTTQINPGVTLSVVNADTAATVDFLAARLNTAPETTLGHVAILGQGRLIVGDTNTVLPAAANRSLIRIHAASVLPGPFWQTLDMSGLNYFACNVSEIRVGANGSSGSTQGTLILAKTNLIMVGSSTALNGYVGFSIGLSSYTTGDSASAGDVQLGQENEMRLYALNVGCLRATNVSLAGPGGGVGGASKAGAGGTMEFQSGLVNPTLKIRGVDGQRGVQNLMIGDNTSLGAFNSTNTATGVMDLTGGTVDILAANLQLGRNNGNTTATRTGSGFGTLTWTDGTIEVTNIVRVGRQAGNNAGLARGVLNVRNNAVLKHTGAGAFDIGGDNGSAAGSGDGVVNIEDGGVVTAIGSIVEGNATGGNGSSVINVKSGFLATGGAINVDTVNLTSGVVSNTGLMTVTALTGTGTVGGPVTGGVAPGGPSIGTLNIYNDLTLSETCTNVFDINLDTLACDKVVGLNSLALGGTLTVINSGGQTAAKNGATLQLFDAKSYAGQFSALELPELPAGLYWSTNDLATGVLKITDSVAVVPVPITTVVAGNSLTLSWPVTGWTVQSNSVNVAEPASWYDVPGSETGTSLNITMDSAQPKVFYRLRQ